MKIADELAELRGLNLAALVERYLEVFGKAPRCKQPAWLFKKMAWELQARRLGGLSETAKARLEALIAEIDLPLASGARSRTSAGADAPTLGTTLSRAWKGREIRATAVEGGWEHEGRTYRSLSAVAKHVTGAHWNGKLFFGLTKRKPEAGRAP